LFFETAKVFSKFEHTGPLPKSIDSTYVYKQNTRCHLALSVRLAILNDKLYMQHIFGN